MTSPSLRNLRTILWSMLPKTDLVFAGRGLSRRLRNAGLAALALAVLASFAGADESPGRARLEPGSPQPPKESVTQSESGRARVSKTKKSPGYWQSSSGPKSPVPAVPASRTRVLPTDEPITKPPLVPAVPAQAVVIPGSPGRNTTTPPLAGDTKSMISAGSRDPARSLNDWESDFSARMDNVVERTDVDSPSGSVGEWWSERTRGILDRDRPARRNAFATEVGHVRQAAAGFIANHTLPDEVDFDVDVYDANPKALMAPANGQSGAQESASDTAAASTESRLKTDIRSIQPTLSYALKNIQSNQLPADFDAKMDNGEYVARSTSPTVLQWAPTNFYHYPLYFEDPSLERYGHTYHPLVQPFASTGRFATQLVGLPYQMALHPIASREYGLGYYRPGEYAPKKHYQIPFNEEATLMEVAIITGLILIVP